MDIVIILHSVHTHTNADAVWLKDKKSKLLHEFIWCRRPFCLFFLCVSFHRRRPSIFLNFVIKSRNQNPRQIIEREISEEEEEVLLFLFVTLNQRKWSGDYSPRIFYDVFITKGD